MHTSKSKSCDDDRSIKLPAVDERQELSDKAEGAGLGSLASSASCRGKIWGSTLHDGDVAAAWSRNSCKERDSIDEEGRLPLAYFSMDLAGDGTSHGPVSFGPAWPGATS